MWQSKVENTVHTWIECLANYHQLCDVASEDGVKISYITALMQLCSKFNPILTILPEKWFIVDMAVH